jgi:hypothetical protein
MRIAAQLYIEPGVLVPGQVGRHDERRAAEERERRRQHSAVSDRQKLGNARALLRLEQRDRVGTVFVGNEVRQSRPRHRRSAGTTEVVPFLRGEIHVRLPSAVENLRQPVSDVTVHSILVGFVGPMVMR